MAPRQENIVGTALTGRDGDNAGGTYDLAYADAVADSLFIIVDNSPWQLATDYEYASGTVTFTRAVWDDSKVTLRYTTSPTGGLEDAYYCLPGDVKRILRLPQAFSVSTNPTDTEVYSFIEDTMTEIDTLTRRAWRSRTKTKEYHDVPDRWMYEYGVGLRLKLGHRFIKTLDTSEGDKIEVWNGTAWEDYVANKTEGRSNDYWLDEEEGFLHIMQRFWFHRKRALRVTYRYGEATIPKDIRKACALLVAAEVLASDDYSASVNESAQSSNTTHLDRISSWKRSAGAILSRYQDFFMF